MKESRPLCIGMALAFSWLSKSGWRRQDSQVERLFSPELYSELACRAEKAKLDFVFRPDTLFLNPEALYSEPGFSTLDPIALLSFIASKTSQIGLVATVSTSFYPPYIAARQLQSLQWISNGRAGWNIVTAIDGQRNFGLSSLSSSEVKYSKAEEFFQVVEKLWQSFPYDALIIDRESGQYADASKIESIHHDSEFFHVEGPLNVPSYPYGQMAYFQAGASDSGRQFSATYADAVFAATPTIQSAVELKKDLVERRAKLQGISEKSAVKVLPGLSLFLGDSRQEAQELYESTHKNMSYQRRFEYLENTVGVDFSSLTLDTPIDSSMLPQTFETSRSQTHATLIRDFVRDNTPTLKQLLESAVVIGSAHWLVVGTVDDAVDSIVKWKDAGAMDGFIAVPGGSVECMALFFDKLLPRLQALGLMRAEYENKSFKETITS
ncbi:NtaA/DmoA family FMN-dependent monooxygenase [Vibrio sp.]|nr:NtaA/DmoA family FMN-dependent monooxygenase [Vibrio sp.]